MRVPERVLNRLLLMAVALTLLLALYVLVRTG